MHELHFLLTIGVTIHLDRLFSEMLPERVAYSNHILIFRQPCHPVLEIIIIIIIYFNCRWVLTGSKKLSA
jgi:hypothetical protein